MTIQIEIEKKTTTIYKTNAWNLCVQLWGGLGPLGLATRQHERQVVANLIPLDTVHLKYDIPADQHTEPDNAADPRLNNVFLVLF